MRCAQQALKDTGYDTRAIDGQMGPATEGALRNFQQAQGLPQSGNLDQQTLSKLGVEGQGDATSGSTSSGAMCQGSASSAKSSCPAK